MLVDRRLLTQKTIFLLILLFCSSCVATSNQSNLSFQKNPKGFAVFDNPDYGKIFFDPPLNWVSEFDQNEEKRTVTFIFTPEVGNSFQLMIDPLVNDGHKITFQNQDIIKSQVERYANRILPVAIEKELVIKSIKGKYSNGYYYSATDKNPKNGEWECMTQGRIGVGVYLLHFTVFSRTLDAVEIEQALTMLATATYVQ